MFIKAMITNQGKNLSIEKSALTRAIKLGIKLSGVKYCSIQLSKKYKPF